jgi:hypothetical protein
MGVSGALRQLAEFLNECERADAVETVGLVECNESSGEGLSADVELALARPPSEDRMELCATSVNADGTLRLGFETAEPVVPAADHDVDIDPTGATLSPDGEVRIVLSTSVASGDSAGGTSADAAGDSKNPSDGTSTESRDRDRDVPPFKDPDLLASVYESCDTFAEMAETLEMDVTAETVRRYMIDYDIHEPNSYDTVESSEDRTTDPGDDEPVVLSDGIGLPEDITVDALIKTVKQSNTIYEVKRDMGVDREDALEMLRDLNLLDLVVGRLATEAERDISRGDVVERLREASATRAR